MERDHMYVIQERTKPWENKWVTLELYRFETLERAMEILNKLPMKQNYRIAEEYTVTRYKPVKMDA